MKERHRIRLSKKVLLLSLALLGLHDSCAFAETCFTNNKYPKFTAPEAGDYETWTYSTIYSEAALAVFSGGIELKNNNPWIMRVDTDTARVSWRRYVDTSAVQMVSAMSVESTGTYLAVLLAAGDNAGGTSNYGSGNEISLFVVRTADGGHHT